MPRPSMRPARSTGPWPRPTPTKSTPESPAARLEPLAPRAGSLPQVKLASAQPARRRAARARNVAVPAAAKGHDADIDLPKAPAEAVEIGVELVGDDGVVV